MTDITVIDSGSILLLQPNTPEAESWIGENVVVEPGDFQPHYPTIACERRYVFDLLYGMQESGLTLETEGRTFMLEPA